MDSKKITATGAVTAPDLQRRLLDAGLNTPAPTPEETARMTMLVILDLMEDGDFSESIERAAESLVHQVRLLRLAKAADAAGVVKK